MTFFLKSENLSAFENDPPSSFGVVMGTEDRFDVYRRYLNNLNLNNTTDTNVSLIIRNYARMLLSENTTYSQDLAKLQIDESTVKPLNNKFYVANSQIVLITLTVIYVTIFVLGVAGNVVTCIVIANPRNKSMHTAVNYYLFSLSISDLLLLITALPDEVYMLWFQEYPFGETVCKIHKFAAESFTNATVLTITAFTIERYVAICKPFLSHTMSKLSRAYKFILFIWVISICLALPQTLFTLHLDETYRICVPKQDYNLFVVSSFLLFVLPMSIITVLYILIGLQLRRSKIVQRSAFNGSSVRLKRKIFKKSVNQTLVTVNCESHYNDALLQHDGTKVSKNHLIETDSIMADDGRINYSNRGHSHGSRHVVNMLVVVVICFFISWGPFHVQRIIFTYIDHSSMDENLSFSLNYISGVLFFVSTFINPIIYNLLSSNFRKAFKVTLASYLSRNSEKRFLKNNKLFRTMSVNSTSINTCSSVCSIQPFSHQQQLSFRYFDSDMARRRPLVVSFRRIQKMNPNNLSTTEQFQSICDVHRTNAKLNDEYATMKLISKYGRNVFHHRNDICFENQSCNRFCSNVKHKTFLESFCDGEMCDKNVFPKEKYYGNAKILPTVNDDILKKNTNESDQERNRGNADNKQFLQRRNFTGYNLMRNYEKKRYDVDGKLKTMKKFSSIPRILTDDMEEKKYEKCEKGIDKNEFSSSGNRINRPNDVNFTELKTSQKAPGSKMCDKSKFLLIDSKPVKATGGGFRTYKKSFSAPSLVPSSIFMERTENEIHNQGSSKF